MYTVVEWSKSPEADLSLINVEGDEIGPPVLVKDESRALAAPNPVCFRISELERSSGAGLLLAQRAVDGSMLARIIFPMARSYAIDEIARALSIAPETADAAGRARTTAQVWAALVAELEKKPWPILNAMAGILATTSVPIRPLIEHAAGRALTKAFGGAKTLDDFLPRDVSRHDRPPAKDPTERLDVSSVCEMFGESGPISKAFREYESRPEQVQMVNEICEAFNESLILLVQAGTGTGKSLAYLVPSILWAVKNEDPVVISTNTKNLQAQLYDKDLPILEKAIGRAFKYALIKGRSNYLCARKLLALLSSPERELSEDERLAMLPVLAWFSQTKTGDAAELSGISEEMRGSIWPKISTDREECLGPRCRRSSRCFVRRARMLALQADVVIANHATVFWESEADAIGVVLPAYRNIIFDEAHNLENVATDAFSLEVHPYQLSGVMGRLFRGRADGAGRGLFSAMRYQLSRVAATGFAEPAAAISGKIGEIIESFNQLRELSDKFFIGVGKLFSEVRRNADQIRYDADNRPDDWPALTDAARDLREAVLELCGQLERLQRGCEAIEEMANGAEAVEDLVEVAAEVGGQAANLREWIDQFDMLLKGEGENFVFWAERDSRSEFGRLRAAPLDVSPMMEEKIFSRVRSAVFASATMAQAGSFRFMRERLGAKGTVAARLREIDLGTSFDFPRQVLMAAPIFLPEPRGEEDGFVRPFSKMAVEVLRASRGRGLVLFTSHAMLRAARTLMMPALEKSGIRLLAQGVDGDRAHLVEQFKEGPPTVLFGTQSFWEGVDVPGEALSCLIVAKLPFRIHTEPIVDARCKRIKAEGRNDFMEYMVPDATLRLLQGFGRLIRTRTDRGVVVLCDSRMMTKHYGQAFRKALPVKPTVFRDTPSLAAAVTKFLG